MGLQNETIRALSSVTAELNYLAPLSVRPRTYTYDPPTGEARSNVLPEPHLLPIHDARAISGILTLDSAGFALVRHQSRVTNFYDEDQVKSVYYPEAEQLLKGLTGASRVFIFDHTVRKRIEGAADRRNDEPRQPVGRVHVDHTAKSGPQRVRDLIPDAADDLLKGRVQVINLWRPIRGPLKDAPLAVCDARTVAFEELVPADLVYPHRVGETYAVRFSPQHQWFYFPDMTASEVLLLKCYDSKTDGRARFAPHSAFTDPTSPADARPRESIELRALVFHKE
ncbi:CmcJ/NvfI family oxidoreductase [Bradyrhizobium sp. LHD-71]|uniref:CmcJ/NvfI family oxidoreductase n=1 Tax=Bradyrhizobium sp. LHD-71 TaxID=3072141 RepID=UPI00280E1E77|nr:CmcJ/NvfI family oxidoreductase [Bradyrhizobium sp. LHD-71]MDQ8728179.1 CmcJ/NvfI family oxidoreductase [Bradyrhizobium sp. LHD-71]